MAKYGKNSYRKRAKKYAKKFWKRRINRPKADSAIRITCDTEIPIYWHGI